MPASCACVRACRCKEEVEQLVLDLRNVRQQQEKGGKSNSDIKQLRVASNRLTRGTWKALKELVRWQCMGPGEAAAHSVTSEQLDAMLRGEPAPWEADGPRQGGDAQLLYYGRLAHGIMADQARCIEQLRILGVERTRLQAWLQFMSAECLLQHGNEVTGAVAVQAAASAAEAWQLYGADGEKEGRMFFLGQHYEWCQRTHAAVAAFKW